MKVHQRKKIAVIGAGWSGLAAAVQLCAKADVVVFEAGKIAGGRARALGGQNGGFSFLDNGQHIMVGAYRAVRTLLDTVGADVQQAFCRLPLQWYLADGMQFQTGFLPAPWHIAAAVLTAKNITAADKLAFSRQMRALQFRLTDGDDMTVARWLRNLQVSRRLVRDFWQPMVLGALNTPLEDASLNTLAAVVQDGVCREKAAGEYWLPKQDLGTAVVSPAVAYLRSRGVDMRLGTRVGQLALLPGQRVSVDGEVFDAVVTAVAPYHAAALWPQQTPESVRSVVSSYRYHAITTVYLRYAAPVQLPAAMTGFAEGTAQWLIDRGRLGASPSEIAAAISVSEQCGIGSQEDWVERVHADVLRACPQAGRPLESRVITEKRATLASTPARRRPDCAWLHHQNIFPAGDYLHPRYPATLESAVQSGNAAAFLLAAQCQL